MYLYLGLTLTYIGIEVCVLFRYYRCLPEDLVTVCVFLLHLVPRMGHHSCVPLFHNSHEADGDEEHRSTGYSLLALLCQTLENHYHCSQCKHNGSKCRQCGSMMAT